MDIRAALVSVEYWSDPERPELPEALRPISLEQAAAILSRGAAAGPFGKSRRNRSIVTLTVKGIALVDGRPVLRDHRDVLEVLLGEPLRERIDPLIDRIASAFPIPSGPPVLPGDPHELLKWTRREVEMALSSEVPELAPLSVGSCALIGTPTTANYMESVDQTGKKIKDWCSVSPAADAVTVANTVILVSRKFDELAPLMDPQNWDAPEQPADLCNVYFDKTEVVEKNAGGGWDPAKCPPTPGSEWGQASPLPLHEQYRMTWNTWQPALDTRVETVLNTSTDRDPDTASTAFRADYSLREHLATNIGSDHRGGIDVDEGYTRVMPDGTKIADRHMVQSEKRVHFEGWKDAPSPTNPSPKDSSPYYNGLACYSLAAMGNALQEFVCCDVPPPPQPCP